MSSRPPPSEPPDSFSPPGPRPMTALWATGWAMGITWLVMLLMVLLAAAHRGAETDLVSAVACQAIAYLAGLFVILRVHAPESGVRDFVGARPTHWLFYPLAVLLGAAIVIPDNALDLAIQRWSQRVLESDVSERFHALSAAKQGLTAIAFILVGPMIEELIFRGALFRPMLKVHPPWMVVVVTATLFALVHPASQIYLPYALPYLVVGLALGVLRRASGSLAPGVLLHATFNAVDFYAMAARWDPDIPRWAIPASAAAAVLLLGLVLLLGRRSADALLSQEYDRQ